MNMNDNDDETQVSRNCAPAVYNYETADAIFVVTICNLQSFGGH